MDELIVTAAPFADITYGSVISSLVDGVVGVEGIVIRPKMSGDEFTIQEINISAPTIFHFVLMGTQFKNKEIPEHLGLEMKKIRIDLNSKIFVMLQSMQAQAAMQQQQSAPLLIERIDALGCGDVVEFGINEFTAMGYNPLELDVAFTMNYRKAARELNIDIGFKDRDYYDLNVAVQIPFDPDQIKSGKATSEQAISRMQFKYIDTGYHKLRNRYCARLNKGTVNEYVDANVVRLTSALGAILPPETTNAYRNFLKNGGTVDVKLNPTEPVKFSALGLYSTADVFDILGLDATINGTNINAEAFIWEKNKTADGKDSEAIVPNEKQDAKTIADNSDATQTPSPASAQTPEPKTTLALKTEPAPKAAPAPKTAPASKAAPAPKAVPVPKAEPDPDPKVAPAPKATPAPKVTAVPKAAPATKATPASVPAKTKASARALETASALAKAKADAKAKAEAKAVQKKFDYRTVNKSRLSKYIGKKVKIETSTDKKHMGMLETVTQNRVRIKVRMGTGEFTFPVKRKEILSVKVYLFQ